jgi:hypothetical protein
MPFLVGSYVVHRKLAELGSGEIMKSEMGTITIRFASGERRFSEVHLVKHLEKTNEAPILPAPTARRAAKKKAGPPKPTAGAKASAASAKAAAATASAKTIEAVSRAPGPIETSDET